MQYLRKVILNLKRDVIEAIKKDRPFEIQMRTKLLALTYSAWSEAQFTQIIYTPNTFTEIQITHMLKDSGIFNKWKILINYIFTEIEEYHKVQKIEKINKIKNDADNGWEKKLQENNQFYITQQTIISHQKVTIVNYLENYIDKQSKVRNKIAHGQWITALNPNNNQIDSILTNELEVLNVFSIMKEFEIHTILGDIIRHLVQSPTKKFNHNYYKNIEKLEIYLDKMSTRNYESFKQDLEMQKQRFNNKSL